MCESLDNATDYSFLTNIWCSFTDNIENECEERVLASDGAIMMWMWRLLEMDVGLQLLVVVGG